MQTTATPPPATLWMDNDTPVRMMFAGASMESFRYTDATTRLDLLCAERRAPRSLRLAFPRD